MIKSNARNFWSDNEINCLLDIIQEQNVLKLLDGKRYKNTTVFEKVEKEMIERGYGKKNREQIITKWRKLKVEYKDCKKMNGKSGEGRIECNYFSKLEEILSMRPTSTLVGFDTEELNQLIDQRETPPLEATSGALNEEEIEPAMLTPSTSKGTTNQNQGQSKRRRNREPSNNVKIFINSQKELQKDFFEKEKELLQMDQRFQRENDERLQKMMMMGTEKLLKKSNDDFFKFISSLKENKTQPPLDESDSECEVEYLIDPNDVFCDSEKKMNI